VRVAVASTTRLIDYLNDMNLGFESQRSAAAVGRQRRRVETGNLPVASGAIRTEKAKARGDVERYLLASAKRRTRWFIEVQPLFMLPICS